MSSSSALPCVSGASAQAFGTALKNGTPVDAFHHEERRAEHVVVVAGHDGTGDQHRFVLDRIEDAELAQHVVRGR